MAPGVDLARKLGLRHDQFEVIDANSFPTEKLLGLEYPHVLVDESARYGTNYNDCKIALAHRFAVMWGRI